MRFEDLDTRLRQYETARDYCVPDGLFVVVRLDGRGFTRLTRETCAFEAPFDARFRDLMTETCAHLMQCGFNVAYAYTQSDEISLLLHPQDRSFARKERKLLSILASEASARFSLSLGQMAAFDARLSLLPSAELVVEYFNWRALDAARNALNAHAYWLLRKQGRSQDQATDALHGMRADDKHQMLFVNGVNFAALPAWQKRGIGLYWRSVERDGIDPRSERPVRVERCVLHTDLELPASYDYPEFVRCLSGD